MNNKTRLYIYIALLFVLTFLLASRIFKGIQTHEFNYINLIANALILAFVIFQVVKIGKIENDKTE